MAGEPCLEDGKNDLVVVVGEGAAAVANLKQQLLFQTEDGATEDVFGGKCCPFGRDFCPRRAFTSVTSFWSISNLVPTEALISSVSSTQKTTSRVELPYKTACTINWPIL